MACLHEAHDQGDIQPCSFGFVPDGLQEFFAGFEIGFFLTQAGAHFAEPAQVLELGFGVFEFGDGRGAAGDGGG
jgi:hypothetical protein